MLVLILIVGVDYHLLSGTKTKNSPTDLFFIKKISFE